MSGQEKTEEVSALEALDLVQREKRGLEEMLAFVLLEVGEPVVVTKDSLKAGLDPDVQISVEDDGDAFIFSLVKDVPSEVV